MHAPICALLREKPSSYLYYSASVIKILFFCEKTIKNDLPALYLQTSNMNSAFLSMAARAAFTGDIWNTCHMPG